MAGLADHNFLLVAFFIHDDIGVFVLGVEILRGPRKRWRQLDAQVWAADPVVSVFAIGADPHSAKLYAFAEMLRMPRDKEIRLAAFRAFAAQRQNAG